MQRSNFQFLESEFPLLANIAQSAERNLYSDPVTCLFKLRMLGEKITEEIYDFNGLDFPYDNTFSTRLRELNQERLLPFQVKDILYSIKNKGNDAVHNHRASTHDAKTNLLSGFKLAKWFYESYSEEQQNIYMLRFEEPEKEDTKAELKALEGKLKALEVEHQKLQEDRKKVEVTSAKKSELKERSQKAASNIEMDEAETRMIIDQQLRSAGWLVDTETLNFKKHKTLPQKKKAMAIAEWKVEGGYADYALFIDQKLYGIVEAKRYSKDISTDLGQSERYARDVQEHEAIELVGKWGELKVPFLYSTNGRSYLKQLETKSGIWFRDIRSAKNHAKCLQGWHTPQGLEKLYQKSIEHAEQKLKDKNLNFLTDKTGLSLREYQLQAIRNVEEKILNEPDDRRALLAMATGTGKTRTTIGLAYRLIQSGRFERILFMVDRNLLGGQAFDDFKDKKVEKLNSFKDIYQVKGMKETIENNPKVPDTTKLHITTVQSMVKRIFYNEDEASVPAVDMYDCIIVDEAHRGYLLDREMDDEELNFKNQDDYVSKYRQVLEYFDAYRIGLTATPAIHTSQIFGSPTFTYSYREAVIDGMLIDHEPPTNIKTKYTEEGIKWEQGTKPKAYDHENNNLIELEELEDDLHIEIDGFNKQVITESFNRVVVQQLVKEIDPEGDGKTLIFCARDDHADLVVKLLKEEYEAVGFELENNAIQKITGTSDKPRELLRRYKNEKNPTIAVTVDLLTTGVDVPAICNLVFLRRVRSRILYEQMLGRATRLCDEIGKEVFRIYDAVRLYEALQPYTQMAPIVKNPKTSFSQLIEEFDHIESTDRTQKQIDQLIAKIQQKKHRFNEEAEEKFAFNTGGENPDEFIRTVKQLETTAAKEKLSQLPELWKFLDEFKPSKKYVLVDEGEDEFIALETGYQYGKKPEDYLDSFKQFISENQNKLTALNIICTRPKELDRQSLKELRIALDQAGYPITALNTAWKQAKNEEITADIIGFIRTMALGSPLLSKEERIKKAMEKVMKLNNWSVIQKKWLGRIEKQLLAEIVLQKDDLNKDPFHEKGGFQKLDKIFDGKLEGIVNLLNEELYQEGA